MENNSNYNFNAYYRYFSALECVIFGEGSYAGVHPKTAINTAKCCTLFYEIVFTSEKENGYWKRQVLNQFTYKIINETQTDIIWKNLFYDYSLELNKLANQCLKIINSEIHSENDEKKVFQLLKPAIDSLSRPYSNAKAQYCLGVYDHKYLKLSADQGFAPAQNRLAYDYSVGRYGDHNSTKCFEYYQLSADQGNAEGQLGLAFCYSYGVVGYVDPDDTKAFENFKFSADQGNARAQRLVADCYRYGKGTVKDEAKAFMYYELSAYYKCGRALECLGECYEKGIGVDPDLTKAIKYYKLAVEEGKGKANFEAKSRLAELQKIKY